jgi:hypothetical protein
MISIPAVSLNLHSISFWVSKVICMKHGVYIYISPEHVGTNPCHQSVCVCVYVDWKGIRENVIELELDSL